MNKSILPTMPTIFAVIVLLFTPLAANALGPPVAVLEVGTEVFMGRVGFYYTPQVTGRMTVIVTFKAGVDEATRVVHEKDVVTGAYDLVDTDMSVRMTETSLQMCEASGISPMSASFTYSLPQEGGLVAISGPVPCVVLRPVDPGYWSNFQQTGVCGPNNDQILNLNTPTSRIVVTNSELVNNQYQVTIFPAPNIAFPPETRSFTDIGNCPTDAPVVPELVNGVCGPDNDIYSEPAQPAYATMTNAGVWPGYNDKLIIPPQPKGVSVDDDTGWEDGTRTITFAFDPTFTTDGERVFTFTDENIACPVPLTMLSVRLVPSDGGSLEGGGWKLYAPVAAQYFAPNPYVEGTVGASNTILVEDLLVGTYRLVVHAEGYEPVDTIHR